MAKGLTLARSFYLSGHRVIGADFEAHNIPCSGRFSRSLSAFYRLPEPNTDEGRKTYIQCLTQIINTEKVELWVACSGVASAIEDAQAKEIIEQETNCKCIQFDVQTTSTLHEKGAFMDECKRIGLPVPETHEVKSQRDVLRVLSKARPKQKFILKPVGTDDRHRGDMTLLPLASDAQTRDHVARLPISKSRPWILQRFVPGGEEYCTHALVVRGAVRCFAACPGASLLMRYEALPRGSALWKSMLAFTVELVRSAPRPEAVTGHLSLDFMAGEGTPSQNGFAKNIYAIECNPRAHTAAVLFARRGPEMEAMVRAYLSALELDGKGAAGQAAHLKEQGDGAQNAFETVLTLIEEQARLLPDQPALGFADFTLKDPFQWHQTVATFSTTPLYHGGLADCFRAWTSGAMIWFFPEGAVPITGNNIVRSVAYARTRSSVPVKYFSSVPYVLQLLADEREGIRVLQSMDLVGVGGAALAPSIGDKLVDSGANLVSRMGSSECGFLMSSHRDYAKDKEWQYLRPIVDPKFLSFESRGDGLSELVVKPSWPLISKTNRDDGSYATADLFEPHPSIPNAWRYHSRADAQITLANGKKFDPSPLEEAIKVSTRLVKDVLVFGAGRDYAGVLLFKTSNTISDYGFINSIWPQIKKLNAEVPSHSRLSRSMLIAIDPENDEEPLAKSSKGTILRHQAEARYASTIREAYVRETTSYEIAHDISDKDLYSAVLKLFNQVLGHDVDPRQDFFQQGVDSIACIQVRKLIECNVLPNGSSRLPVSIIYDSGNVNSLVGNLIRIREGSELSSPCNDAASMSKLISKYSNFPKFVPGDRQPEGEVVLLTGTTGSLGAHILSQLVSLAKVKTVYCLVRAGSAEEAKSRVVLSLKSRKIFHPAVAAKAICLPSDFSQESLGLDPLAFETVRSTVTTVFHSAWMVNFNVGLSSFERSHIAGVHNMIKLCLSVPFQTPAKFFFISSISAASGTPAPATIREVHIEDLHHAPNTGYAGSKLVTEHIIRAAAKSTGIYARVLRTGQLIGDIENGLWNSTEAIPLMIQSATTIGALPILDETPSWLPVDKCASAVLELSGLTLGAKGNPSGSYEEVYHVLNPTTFSWTNDLLPALRAAGLKFEIVTPLEWVQRLRESEQNPQKNPAVKLLDFYVEKYCGNRGEQNDLIFETRTTAKHSETIKQGFDIIQNGVMQKCLYNWQLGWAKQQ
ncbi:hypothetical protein Hte_000743 [Hypoxylon texense]